MTHKLKIEQNYLDNILSGKKKSEIRLNDRDYQVGDLLVFTVYSNSYPFTIEHKFVITHIHSGLGLEKHYVVLSIEEIK